MMNKITAVASNKHTVTTTAPLFFENSLHLSAKALFLNFSHIFFLLFYMSCPKSRALVVGVKAILDPTHIFSAFGGYFIQRNSLFA